MDHEARIKEITRMCDIAGCNTKVRKIHFEQFVNKQWHPHPPEAFIDWWAEQIDCTVGGVKAKVAWNCQRYRDEFNEIRAYGGAGA